MCLPSRPATGGWHESPVHGAPIKVHRPAPRDGARRRSRPGRGARPDPTHPQTGNPATPTSHVLVDASRCVSRAAHPVRTWDRGGALPQSRGTPRRPRPLSRPLVQHRTKARPIRAKVSVEVHQLRRIVAGHRHGPPGWTSRFLNRVSEVRVLSGAPGQQVSDLRLCPPGLAVRSVIRSPVVT